MLVFEGRREFNIVSFLLKNVWEQISSIQNVQCQTKLEAIVQKLHFGRQTGIKLEKPNTWTLVTVPVSLLNCHFFKSITL